MRQKNFTKQMQNGLSHSGKKMVTYFEFAIFHIRHPSSLYCIMLRGTRSKYIQYKIKKVSCNPPATFIHFVLLGHPIPVCESINHFCTSNRALFMITRARIVCGKLKKLVEGNPLKFEHVASLALFFHAEDHSQHPTKATYQSH